jgi:hypothetical protein
MYYTRGVWCGFGGHPITGECIEFTASREFTEETMGCVRMGERVVAATPNTCIQNVYHCLRTHDYLFRLNVRQPPAYVDHTTAHIVYVKQVPWQPDISNTFDLVRAQLLDIVANPTRLSTLVHPSITRTPYRTIVDQHYLEKQHVEWWSLDRLQDIVYNNGRYKSERFRKSFLPILQIIIDKLKSPRPQGSVVSTSYTASTSCFNSSYTTKVR